MKIEEIKLDEFEDEIYDKYVDLFPSNERRDIKKIRRTYKDGIEKFYKISLDNNIIGFFMLERLNEYPYYLDYFGIDRKYQNSGYGTEALKLLMKDVIKETGLIGEIEKVIDDDPITRRRLNFYKRLGFSEIGSEYSLYNVLFNPIVYMSKYNKEEMDSIFFEYYKINIGLEGTMKNCKIIK